MNSMLLQVKYEDTTWEIPIERRITILRGDSGTGKTSLINLITAHDGVATVNFPLRISAVTEDTWDDVMLHANNRLIIFDDLGEIVMSKEFASIVSKTEASNNYLLVINREVVDYSVSSKNDVPSMLSIATSSILRFKVSADGLQHFTEPYFK